jgi:nicotinamide mononucleotide transporter
MMTWLQLNWMELAGTVCAIVYLYLSVRENIWLWPVGFLTSLLYLIVFYHSRLYADMGLQVYYLLVSVYGWIHWMGRKNGHNPMETNLLTTSISIKQWVVYSSFIAVLTLLLYFLLKHLPGLMDLPPSDLPLGDAFTTAGGIVATWMLARKMLENWLVWIVINGFSLGMYLYKELYITVFLFIIYTVMAVVGYYKWKGNMPPDSEPLYQPIQ